MFDPTPICIKFVQNLQLLFKLTIWSTTIVSLLVVFESHVWFWSLMPANRCTDVDRNDKSRICIPGSVKVSLCSRWHFYFMSLREFCRSLSTGVSRVTNAEPSCHYPLGSRSPPDWDVLSSYPHCTSLLNLLTIRIWYNVKRIPVFLFGAWGNGRNFFSAIAF